MTFLIEQAIGLRAAIRAAEAIAETRMRRAISTREELIAAMQASRARRLRSLGLRATHRILRRKAKAQRNATELA